MGEVGRWAAWYQGGRSAGLNVRRRGARGTGSSSGVAVLRATNCRKLATTVLVLLVKRGAFLLICPLPPQVSAAASCSCGMLHYLSSDRACVKMAWNSFQPLPLESWKYRQALGCFSGRLPFSLCFCSSVCVFLRQSLVVYPDWPRTFPVANLNLHLFRSWYSGDWTPGFLTTTSPQRKSWWVCLV